MTFDSRSAYFNRVRRQVWHLHRFLKRQLDDLKTREHQVALRKFWTLITFHLPKMMTKLLLLPWAIFGLLVIRLFRPILKIRIGPINVTRVGHLVLDVEMMLTEDEFRRGSNPDRVFDVWYPWSGKLGVANSYILDLWKRRLFLVPRLIAEPVDSLNRLLPGGDANIIPYRKGVPLQLGQHHDIMGARKVIDPHLVMPEEDVAKARDLVARLGILPSDKFVCLQVRDSAYLRWQTGRNWFDDPDRNAEIDDYVPAVGLLIERGYKVVRMGVVAEKPLRGSWGNNQVVDLPFCDLRSELLDVYFGTHCRFFVTTGSGIDALAHASRIPLVTTNVSDYIRDLFLTHESISIIRRPIEASSHREVSLREFVASGFHMLKPEELSEKGIRFIPNTPEEIADAVAEAIDADEQGFELYLERMIDESGQAQFRDAFPTWMFEGGVRGVVSPRFLCRHSRFVS